MAYFDSPKNRAIWERHLASLRQEKERRRETGYAPAKQAGNAAEKKKEEPSYRRHISFAELERREKEKEASSRSWRPGRELRAEKQPKQKRSPEKKGPQL